MASVTYYIRRPDGRISLLYCVEKNARRIGRPRGNHAGPASVGSRFWMRSCQREKKKKETPPILIQMTHHWLSPVVLLSWEIDEMKFSCRRSKKVVDQLVRPLRLPTNARGGPCKQLRV